MHPVTVYTHRQRLERYKNHVPITKITSGKPNPLDKEALRREMQRIVDDYPNVLKRITLARDSAANWLRRNSEA